MTVEGFDFSWGRPGGAAIAAAGRHFACRYLLDDGQGGKGLDASEVRDYQSHGVSVVLCYEVSAGGWRGGQAQGVKDGQAARAQMTALGVPADRPCYFAVDQNTLPSDFATVDAYLRGCAQGMGDPADVGVYGEADLVDHCIAAGTARWAWQTYAWSAGRVSTRAHLYQYSNGHTVNGAAVDYDRGLRADFGQWPKPVTSYSLVIPARAVVEHNGTDRAGRVVLPWVRTTWGTKASSAPCTAPTQKPTTKPGVMATVVFVPAGRFKGQWVHMNGQVRVASR
jgi:hypothetical protein